MKTDHGEDCLCTGCCMARADEARVSVEALGYWLGIAGVCVAVAMLMTCAG